MSFTSSLLCGYNSSSVVHSLNMASSMSALPNQPFWEYIYRLLLPPPKRDTLVLAAKS